MYKVHSYQIAQSINIKLVKGVLNAEIRYGDSDELFLKLDEKQYLYVFQFGIVSFFNTDATLAKGIIAQIIPHTKGSIMEALTENIIVDIEENNLEVSFDRVVIPEFNEEMIGLIMLHTSQSVALDRFSEITEALLEEASVHTKHLELNGRLNISSRKLKKLIGRNLNLKNAIYENLYIFDSPDVVWQDQQLAKLDDFLKKTFDLKNRYRNIQDRIGIIKDNLELFKGIWDHKESSTLEWIIIILIFVEIIDLFFTKIL